MSRAGSRRKGQKGEGNEAQPRTVSLDFLGAGLEELEAVLGTRSKVLQDHLVRQLIGIGAGAEEESQVASRGVAVVADIAPQSALEALLAVQMVATHELALEFARRARQGEMLDQVTAHANLMVKLERSFVAQIEALERLRGRKSEQTVTVRHVTGENVVQGEFGAAEGEGG